jgi:hypothetical protein
VFIFWVEEYREIRSDLNPMVLFDECSEEFFDMWMELWCSTGDINEDRR